MECGKKGTEGLSGHLIALATICVWGSTFIFSKTLLSVFTPCADNADALFSGICRAVVYVSKDGKNYGRG